MICSDLKALAMETPLSAALKPAQTPPGDGSLTALRVAFGKKADAEMLIMALEPRRAESRRHCFAFGKPLISISFMGKFFALISKSVDMDPIRRRP